MSTVEARRARRSFGSVEAVAALDLTIASGQFVSVIGPSGCGKSTLLRMIAGLVAPDDGEILIDGSSAASARRAKRIGMVPQAPGLLPWRTVEENARLLTVLNRRQGADGSLPGSLLDEVGLADVAGRLPHELSGGMQQRVALVRALAIDAPLLLMDEPFAALDEITRTGMRGLVSRLVERRSITTLLVTHSIAEAVALSDRVLVTSPRPARVVADITIDLPRPRPADVEDDSRFVALCAEVRRELNRCAGATS
ncbi:MAG: ABC transporter ATP-binding protein [Ilumatobacteraceae bacterium]